VPEPTTLTAGAIAAAVSAATMAFFGVDYYSLLYGLVGALLALPHVEQMGRGRAVAFVVLSTLAGAVIGNGFAAYVDSKSRPVLIMGCLVGGLVAQALAGQVLQRVPRLVDALIKRVMGRSS
jgi:predicted aconitase with swiveling domain